MAAAVVKLEVSKKTTSKDIFGHQNDWNKNERNTARKWRLEATFVKRDWNVRYFYTFLFNGYWQCTRFISAPTSGSWIQIRPNPCYLPLWVGFLLVFELTPKFSSVSILLTYMFVCNMPYISSATFRDVSKWRLSPHFIMIWVNIRELDVILDCDIIHSS